MLTNVPSTLRTPVGIPRSIPTLYACRARVPAPVPMIILWLDRLATSSSITGSTRRPAPIDHALAAELDHVGLGKDPCRRLFTRAKQQRLAGQRATDQRLPELGQK